jgi:hypothetical protein
LPMPRPVPVSKPDKIFVEANCNIPVKRVVEAKCSLRKTQPLGQIFGCTFAHRNWRQSVLECPEL